MARAKSYIQARELLFTRLLTVSTIFVSLVCILNLFSQKYQELYLSIGFLLILGFIWISFIKEAKNLAYHLLLWSFIILLCYPIFIQGNSYYAIIIYPLAALIYNFVFFDNQKILWIYFGLFVVLEFFLLASTMKLDFGNIPIQFYAEYINSLAYMISIFFIGRFFITSIKKQQSELHIAKSDIEEKQKELINKNETLDKYIESNIQLESFAHLAAHELKAPLRSISGFAGLLQRKIKDKLTPEEAKMFGIISTSNRQMHDMINALNQLGSVSKMNLTLSDFDINELIAEILFDRKEAIQESCALVKQNISMSLVSADRVLLKQLLSNIIGNALKFVPEGETPEVQISAEIVKDNFVFKIDDNGIGIKEEDRKKIFTLFERLNNSKSFSGSGIGLAICKKIVDLHRGDISVVSKSPNGSSFSVSIPAK